MSETVPTMRRRKPRRRLYEANPLTITSLLDIMTIILVFLLKSYSANPVTLKPSEDLKLPSSSSDVTPTESTSVTVTLNALLVNNEAVARLDNGLVAESSLSDNGMLVEPLFAELQDQMDKARRVKKLRKKSTELDQDVETEPDLVTIISDRRVHFSLLSKVMYTAGRAKYGRFKFVVIKRT